MHDQEPTSGTPQETLHRLGSLLAESVAEAGRLNHGYLGLEHLFIALLRRGGETERLVRRIGLDPVTARDVARREAGQGKAGAAEPVPTPRLLAVLGLAGAGERNGALGEVCLLRAMLEEGQSLPVRYLCAFGLRPQDLLARLGNGGDGTSESDATRLSTVAGDVDATRVASAAIGPPAAGGTAAPAQAGPPITPLAGPTTLPTPTLDRFGRDLAKLAVVGFVPLRLDDLAAILEQVLAEKALGFRTAQGIDLQVDDLVKVLILDSAYDPRMGARPLERAVDEQIVQPLVDAIFAGRIRAGSVRAVIEGVEIVFRQEGG